MPLTFRPPSLARRLATALAVIAGLALAGAGGYWYWLQSTNLTPSAEGRALLAAADPAVLRDIRDSRDHFTCAGIGAKSFGTAAQENHATYLFREDTRELLGQSGSACVGRDCSQLFPAQKVWAAQGCQEQFFAHADRKARTIPLEGNGAPVAAAAAPVVPAAPTTPMAPTMEPVPAVAAAPTATAAPTVAAAPTVPSAPVSKPEAGLVLRASDRLERLPGAAKKAAP